MLYGRTVARYAEVAAALGPKLGVGLLNTALDIALQFLVSPPIVRALIEAGAEVNMPRERSAMDMSAHDGFTPLLWACSSRHEPNVSLLLEMRARADVAQADGSGPLALSTEELEMDIVQVLLGHLGPGHPEINRSFGVDEAVTPLWMASWVNSRRIGIASTAVGCSSPEELGGMRETRSWEIVQLLLEARAEPKQGPDGTWPLHRACLSGCERTVALLLSHGSDVNHRTDVGDPTGESFTPLMCACKGSYDLLRLGPRGSTANDAGDVSDADELNTKLSMYDSIAVALIHAHADLDAICWRGDSAVVLAAHRTSLLQLVLDAGCDTTRLVQSRCTFGNPNAVECTRGCVSCSQATVQRALRHAKGNEECILLLKQAAAQAAEMVAARLEEEVACEPAEEQLD